MMYTIQKHKALAYITNHNRLLVFRHTAFPEAGIQVPAGTIEPGEDPAEAARREAEEESGLTGLPPARFLAADDVDLAHFGLGWQRWHFFHFALPGLPPETWRHWELHASDGGPPIEFEFFWVPLGAVPPLMGGQERQITRIGE